jgi:parallel beta-helix repeat protein
MLWPYKYIWQGIENASDGDIVRVYAGYYNERLTVNKKLSIIGNGSGTTTIDGEGKTVVKITSDDIFFSKFDVVNGSRGIFIDSASNISIYKNNLKSNEGDGIFIDSSSNNFINNNSILNNANTGIWLLNTVNSKIENNSINGHTSYPGIYLQRSSDNYFFNNDIFDNAGGITISESLKNIFFGNIINNNQIQGILIQDNSNNNRIYGNHLINNGQWYQKANARDECTNYWDNGHPGNNDYVYTSGDPWCGNQWSDHWFGNKDGFKGPNQDIPGRDGIADTPYQITGGDNVDEYPILYSNDSNPPTCEIREPESGFAYFFGRQIKKKINFLGDAALVIGPCTVEVLAEDDSAMAGVNFYWDTNFTSWWITIITI